VSVLEQLNLLPEPYVRKSVIVPFPVLGGVRSTPSGGSSLTGWKPWRPPDRPHLVNSPTAGSEVDGGVGVVSPGTGSEINRRREGGPPARGWGFPPVMTIDRPVALADRVAGPFPVLGRPLGWSAARNCRLPKIVACLPAAVSDSIGAPRQGLP
jgi:hypothetical protein